METAQIKRQVKLEAENVENNIGPWMFKRFGASELSKAEVYMYATVNRV